MTLTNHLLTGSLLAKLLPLPIALPLAFLSHFVLDSLPHFGLKNEAERKRLLWLDYLVVSLDFLTALVVSAWLLRNNHATWLLAGLLAFSPDLMWIYRFIVQEKFGQRAPSIGGKFVKFHAGIQKYERNYGWVIEIVVALGLFTLVSK